MLLTYWLFVSLKNNIFDYTTTTTSTTTTTNNFCFDAQVGNAYNVYSQRVYLLKVLREQSLSR